MRLYQAALAGAPPAPGADADAARLSRAVATLEALLEDKRAEAEEFEAAANRVSSPLLPGGELTDAEKLSLGRCAHKGPYQMKPDCLVIKIEPGGLSIN